MRTRIVTGLLSFAAGLAYAGDAAAVNCSTLPGATYVSGSATAQKLVNSVAVVLSGVQTLIYQASGSCSAVDEIVNGTKLTGTATYWGATGTAQSCALDPAGDAVDVGISEIYSSTCSGFGPLPSGVGDFLGPNQVLNFVVPVASSQTIISAEAAYFVFGFGSNGMVAPWNNPTYLFQRGPSAGIQAILAAAITVPATAWYGNTLASTNSMLSAVAASTSPESRIGILGSDTVDVNRATVRALAYQHFKQSCASLPDSAATSFDKKNVRDGHYPLWAPIHLLTQVDASDTPLSAQAATLIGYFTGTVALPNNADVIALDSAAHFVPACAMTIQRTSEMGPLMPYTPPVPCGCYFDFLTTGTTTCTSCMSDANCMSATASHCRHGYCEAN